MSIYKELSARFSAVDNGITSAFNGIEKSIDKVERKTGQMNKSMSGFFNGISQKTQSISRGFSIVGDNVSRISRPVYDTGKSITNAITKPALVATTVVGGMFGGLGAKRLIAVDNAKAKLEGMGYSAKEVGNITGDVTKAVSTGMTTMGEGIDIAAGAMGAGVKEGKELQKYIKLVGDAAIAGRAPVGEMAQIFNRVQGTGKLMRNELDMINHRMPGFTGRMAESMGVTREVFEEMVSAGEVTSEDFLKAMDSYAGGAAEAYAKTFEGMGKNALAYVGILGEKMLGKIFEDGKAGLARLIEVLNSDEALAAAERIGDKIKVVSDKIVGFIKEVSEWWNSLSEETREKATSIMKWIGIISVTIGPILTILGGVGLAVGKIISGIGKYFGIVSSIFSLLGKISTPVGWVILAIGALSTAFMIAYNKSETFRNAVGRVGDKVQEVYQWFVEFKNGVVGLFTDEGDSGLRILKALGFSDETIQLLYDITGEMMSIFYAVKNSVQAVINMFKGDWLEGRELLERIGFTPEQIIAVENFVLLIQSKIHAFKQTVKTIFNEVFGFIKSVFNDFKIWWQEDGALIVSALGTLFKDTFKVISDVVKIAFSIITNIFETVLPIIKGMWDTFWPLIKATVINTWNVIKLAIGTAMDLIRGIISAVSAAIEGDWKRVWEIVKKTAESIWNRIKTFISDTIKNIKSTIVTRITEARDDFLSLLKDMLLNVIVKFTEMYLKGKQKITDFKDSIVENIKQMSIDALEKINDLVEGAKALPGKMKDAFIAGKDKVKEGIQSLGNSMQDMLKSVVNGVIGGLNTVLGKVGIKTEITPWEPTAFSTGTGFDHRKLTNSRGKLKEDTYAVVGDKGPGNGPGTRELVRYPNGVFKLFENATRTFLPKGSAVLNNIQTEEALAANGHELPHDVGVGGSIKKGINKTVNFAKNVGSKVKDKVIAAKDIVKNAIDYIGNPSKLFGAVIDNYFPGISGLSGFGNDFIKGAWKKIKSSMLDWFKGKVSTIGGIGTGSKQSFMDYPITSEYSPNAVLAGYPGFNDGHHYGIDYGTPYGTTIHAPTGGKLSQLNNLGGGLVAKLKSGNITQFFMHLSKVLKSGMVKAGEAIALSGNSGKWTTGPHVHWQAQKDSDVMNVNTFDPRKMLKGYAAGGIVDAPELAWLAEGGFSESIISHDPKFKARSKQIYDRTGEMLGFDEDSLLLNQVVQLLKQGLTLQEINNELVEEVANKDDYIIMDDEIVGKKVAPHVESKLRKERRLKERYREGGLQ